MISSQKDSFIKAHKEGKNFIPIIQTWPADLETPLSTWLKLSSQDSHGVFLESVEGGESWGGGVLLLLNLFGKLFATEKKLSKRGIMEKLKYTNGILLVF